MRTRREQVALHDARAGVRVPSAEELAAGYVDEGLTSAELADRYGITEARVHSMLCRYGIERRPGGIRPERADAERAQRRPPQLIEDIVTLYRSGLSRTATAARVGVHRKLVDDVLRRAGVEFRDRRKLPPVSEWANRYVDDGETAAEIAATFAVAPETVLHALAAAGIERRPAKVRMPPLIDDEVVACYVRERMSLQATAKRLGVSTPRVRAAVGRLGVLRTKFDPSTLDRRRFARRYAAGATVTELGDEFGLTPHQVSVAVRTFDLPPRLPVTHRPLTISDRQLAALITAGHSDADIAARYGVALVGRCPAPPPEPSAATAAEQGAPTDQSGPPGATARHRQDPRRHRHRPQRRPGHRDPLVRPLRHRRRRATPTGGRPRRRARRQGTAPPVRRRTVDGETDRQTTSASTPTWSRSPCIRTASPSATAPTGPKPTRSCSSTPSTPTPTSSPCSSITGSRCAGGPDGWRAASRSRHPSPLASSSTCTATWVCRPPTSRCSPVTAPRTSARCCATTARPPDRAADPRGTNAPSCEARRFAADRHAPLRTERSQRRLTSQAKSRFGARTAPDARRSSRRPGQPMFTSGGPTLPMAAMDAECSHRILRPRRPATLSTGDGRPWRRQRQPRSGASACALLAVPSIASIGASAVAEAPITPGHFFVDERACNPTLAAGRRKTIPLADGASPCVVRRPVDARLRRLCGRRVVAPGHRHRPLSVPSAGTGPVAGLCPVPAGPPRMATAQMFAVVASHRGCCADTPLEVRHRRSDPRRHVVARLAVVPKASDQPVNPLPRAATRGEPVRVLAEADRHQWRRRSGWALR